MNKKPVEVDIPAWIVTGLDVAHDPIYVGIGNVLVKLNGPIT